MNKLISTLGAAMLALAGTQAAAQSAEERGAIRFAELTEGRTAGKPQSCINALRSNDIEIIEHVGIAYEDGDTLWIARATDPRSLDRSDVPVFDRFGSQLCRQDVIRTVDRYSRFVTGAVFLDDFVPYTKQG